MCRQCGSALLAFLDADGDTINATISTLDTRSGAVRATPPEKAARSFGEQLAANNQIIHEGRILGRPGTAAMTLASLCLPAFYITGWMMYLKRRRQKRWPRLSQPDARYDTESAGPDR
jgi:sulfite reductase (NADPH) flavoprotein alpha-component